MDDVTKISKLEQALAAEIRLNGELRGLLQATESALRSAENAATGWIEQAIDTQKDLDESSKQIKDLQGQLNIALYALERIEQIGAEHPEENNTRAMFEFANRALGEVP